ncbi:MAG TPA: hypothetical protein VFL57_14410 [Bryobacteraceae bacterium]|nr:hypothetical protein [Bryobacteraceae bacterium]
MTQPIEGRWKLHSLVLLVALLVLFVIGNRSALRGYFQDDDLDTLGWTWAVPLRDYATHFVTPKLSEYNFRPVGHFFYRVLEAVAGLDYRWWVLGLWILHAVTAGLLWLLLREAGVGPLAALAGLVFFAFHPATFDAYWRSMYVFDVLCGMFSVASVLAYAKRHWVVSFLCFWAAFKSKELAIMLPAVLLAWEYTRGERKWRRLLPFLAVSVLFGVQALLQNRANYPDYTFRLTSHALRVTLPFYFYRAFVNFGIGATLLLSPLLLRDRRLVFGIVSGLAIALPLLFLPGRLFSVYLYVPLAFVAVQVAMLADRWRWSRVVLPAAMLLVWAPATYAKLRKYRTTALIVADDNRAYVGALSQHLKEHPDAKVFITAGRPAAMHHWGPTGALAYLLRGNAYKVAALESDEGRKLIAQEDVVILTWRPEDRQLAITRLSPNAPDASFISVREKNGLSQFETGWSAPEESFRWAQPHATVRLFRPDNARAFEVSANLGELQIERLKKVHLEVRAGGEVIGTHDFIKSGWQTARWPVPPKPAGMVLVEFRTSPALSIESDTRTLGIALGAFGYK